MLALGALGLVGIAGCDLNENADLERGRSLFGTQCGVCHTLAEAGTASTVGPDLDAAFSDSRASGMDDDTIEGVVQAQIANPRAADESDPEYDRVFMPADIVTGQDAEDVAAYVASVAGVPGAEPPELAPPELFTDRCGVCHALAEAGTSATVGPDLDEVLPGQSASQIQESILDPSARLSPGFGDQMPGDFGELLTDEEISGLVEFLRGAVSGGGGAGGE
jgi:mono/diheme cytochrome c family protein